MDRADGYRQGHSTRGTRFAVMAGLWLVSPSRPLAGHADDSAKVADGGGSKWQRAMAPTRNATMARCSSCKLAIDETRLESRSDRCAGSSARRARCLPSRHTPPRAPREPSSLHSAPTASNHAAKTSPTRNSPFPTGIDPSVEGVKGLADWSPHAAPRSEHKNSEDGGLRPPPQGTRASRGCLPLARAARGGFTHLLQTETFLGDPKGFCAV